MLFYYSNTFLGFPQKHLVTLLIISLLSFFFFRTWTQMEESDAAPVKSDQHISSLR
jgi:hypothetical protein